MSTAIYGCGCSITYSMFGDNEVLSVHHCSQHAHLYSQDKTPRQMADELVRLYQTDGDVGVPLSTGEASE